MAAPSIVKRPQGHIADMTTSYDGVVSSSSGALITYTSHGLSTGDFVYIDSNLSSYNGYWYVQKNDNDSFRIREYATASDVSFVNSGTVTYYKTVLAHGWNAVHLPIIYKITNTKWPTNSTDTVRTISSIANDGGYVRLNLSGDIKTTGSANVLEFVQVFGQNAGIYQILNWQSDTAITISFPYDSGVSFSASTVQYYYSDYEIRVSINAGLASGHYWESQKPYETIATVKVVPDSSTGIATIDISQFLKSKISAGENNLALDTFPNDINSFCQFYISIQEYGSASSSGYTLVTSALDSGASDFGVSDLYAVNAMLPFKTQASGFMDEYVSGLTVNTPQKFLTPFSEPVIFEDQYFDLAFIINSSASGFYILEQYYLNGNLLSTVKTNITDNDAGIYRHQVTYSASADTVKVSLYNSANLQLSEIKSIAIDSNCFNNYIDLCWKNYLGGNDYWRFGGGKQITVKTKKQLTTSNYGNNWPRSYGKHADTLKKILNVDSSNEYLIRSQFVEADRAEDIAQIHSSVTVQEITSRNNRRTLLIDDGSFNIREDFDKLVEISFRASYTDDNPVISL